jgi:hypothetical protein
VQATTASLITKGNIMTNLKQKIRARRAYRQYERAVLTATPSMRTELLAMAAHQNYNR